MFAFATRERLWFSIVIVSQFREINVCGNFTACELPKVAGGDYLQANSRLLELGAPAVRNQNPISAFARRQ
jgi:hypothetical protein